MDMKLRVSTLFLAIICVLPLSANAVMIDFRSNGPLTSIRQGDDSLLFTVGLLEVAVYGYELTDFDTALPFQTAVDRSDSVDQSTNGLTFMRAGEADAFIDGAGANELVAFRFNQAVSLSSVNFDFGMGNFRTFSDIGPSVSGITADELQPGTAIPGGFQVFNFVSTPTSTSFALGAFGNDDAFNVRTLTVDPQPVPEPSSLLLLGAGAICLLRRRQRREIGLSSMETE